MATERLHHPGFFNATGNSNKKLRSKRGTLIYLDASLVLQATLERVVAAGDVMALPRQALPPGMGVFAHIGDLDGNFDLRSSRPAPW